MFGCVRLKTVFSTPVKRDGSVRLIDITRRAYNNVVVSGHFIYLLQDNTIQVASQSVPNRTRYGSQSTRHTVNSSHRFFCEWRVDRCVFRVVWRVSRSVSGCVCDELTVGIVIAWTSVSIELWTKIALNDLHHTCRARACLLNYEPK